MNTSKVKTCHAAKVGGDAPANAFYVEAVLENGRLVYHQGPDDAAFFTEHQAEELALNVLLERKITNNCWRSTQGRAL